MPLGGGYRHGDTAPYIRIYIYTHVYTDVHTYDYTYLVYIHSMHSVYTEYTYRNTYACTYVSIHIYM